MDTWEKSDLHEDVYNYGGFYVNHEITVETGYKRHKMSCGKGGHSLRVLGSSFEDAQERIIKKIDAFNNSL